MDMEPTADPSKPEVDPSVGAGAELYDQPSDESAIPTTESVADRLQRRGSKHHEEGLSRFERFSRSLQSSFGKNVFAHPPFKPSMHDLTKD